MKNHVATFHNTYFSLGNLFKLGLPDKLSMLFIFSCNSILLLSLFSMEKHNTFFTFQEAPLYVNSASKMFTSQYNNRSHSESLNILPIPSFLIKLFSFGNYKFGQYIFVIFSNTILYFSFIRLTISFQIPFFKKNSFVFTLLIFSIFPIRFFTFRNAPLPDSLFISFIFLSLLFFQTSHSLLALFFIFLASYTKPEGILLFLVFIIISIFQKNYYNISLFIASFLIDFSIKKSLSSYILVDFSIYQYFIPNYLNFGIENSVHYDNPFYTNLTLTYPQFQPFKLFPIFTKLRHSIGYLRQLHALFLNYGLCFTGSILLLHISPILAIFGFTWLLFAFFLDCYDPIRFLIPLEIISIFCGFSFFFLNERIHFAITLLIIPIFILDIYYSFWQFVNCKIFVS